MHGLSKTSWALTILGSLSKQPLRIERQTMDSEPKFRKPTRYEAAILQRLLEADFPGKSDLSAMINDLVVKPLDQEGSLELQSQVQGHFALVTKRVPVEAEAEDEDGFKIHVLLHVVNGRPTELEIYKDDGSPIRQMPPASQFDLIVLPPAPSTEM